MREYLVDRTDQLTEEKVRAEREITKYLYIRYLQWRFK